MILTLEWVDNSLSDGTDIFIIDTSLVRYWGTLNLCVILLDDIPEVGLKSVDILFNSDK